MQKIGLIGGMSYESTGKYYQIINELINKRLGGLHSARIGIESVDLAEIEALQRQGKWDELGTIMADAAITLENAGADCIVICTNTMHKTAPVVQDLISIPLIHIADATARKIEKKGLNKVALLGTKITMEEDFIKKRITDNYGIEVIVPEIAKDLELIDWIIFNELCRGKVLDHSREIIKRIINDLTANGAKGVILGCTELWMSIRPKDVKIMTFDTASIHAEAAADFALAK